MSERERHMNRRNFVCFTSATAAGLWSGQTLAHHGWSSFDEAAPLYFGGKVKSVKWQNPHAEIVITVGAEGVLPADLAKREIPPQSSSVDGARVLSAAKLPKRRGDWTIELSPMTRINAWKVPQPKPGDMIEAVAYSFKDEKGEMFARVEYLMIDGKLYGLRSNPA
jgi:hypothetical protein